MKPYLILSEKVAGQGPVYEYADILPAGTRVGRSNYAFYAVEPYTVHAKPYGVETKKPIEVTVYGVGREELLVKYNSPVAKYGTLAPAQEWDTVYFHQTTEGYRFVRSVVKVMKVLTSLAKKAAVERNKRERNRAAAKAREGREGTCQICEGAQIIQPTGANKGTLVLHGYRRPGVGYTVGNCFGYHRKPFEVACDALTEWVDMLKEEKVRTEELLAAHEKATVLTIKKHWRTEETEEIGPSDPRWYDAFASRKWNLERSIRSLDSEITHQEGRLEAWHKEHG